MYEDQVYTQSIDTARQNGELPHYRDSKKRNRACAGAIDKAISDNNYELYHYDLKAAAQAVVSEYGLHRVSWVLAHTVQQQEYDGRYAPIHKKWANEFALPHKDTEFYSFQSHPTVLDGFLSRLLELESSLQRIAEHIVQEGTQNTTQGNWIMGFDELPPELGSPDFIAAHQKSLLYLLEQTEAVADVTLSEGGFDVCYYLDYCQNAEPEEPEALPTDREIADKPSILARLQEGKKAAVQGQDSPKMAPKRDSEREV